MSFLEHCEYFADVDSTMTLARHRAAEGAPHGTAIVAETQSCGRGRMGRTWHSPPGAGLWTTVVLRLVPPIDASPVTLLGLVAGIAACSAAQRLGAREAKIKWPNDVVVGERKLCGILTEAENIAGPAPVALVGIGFNLMARQALDLPGEINERYIGLADVVRDANVSATTTLGVLLDAFESWYQRWILEGAHPIVRQWNRCDALDGVDVVAETSTGRITGRAHGISETGALRVHTAVGLVEIVAGDVVRVRAV